ncbi:hypothetical protein [Legionella brunensis]|uniref:Uncharacterized protein n=1 Tax=Legionella brunensis TaxID=29422 RepID=A0A0W0SP97_9GAMM|nr:hypothetical protein [Legionella brunensis]KTC85124.1 hypothetical protein Lbru_0920 [Legionella brunensis]
MGDEEEGLMTNEHKEFTFLESVDTETHDNILRLDQKLKGLQAEIQAKIDAIGSAIDDSSIERKEQLIALSEEVKKAIEGIQKLVNLVIDDDISPSEFNEINHESIDALREIFKDSADKISVIKEKF